jgi:hypothetical protein
MKRRALSVLGLVAFAGVAAACAAEEQTVAAPAVAPQAVTVASETPREDSAPKRARPMPPPAAPHHSILIAAEQYVSDACACADAACVQEASRVFAEKVTEYASDLATGSADASAVSGDLSELMAKGVACLMKVIGKTP